MSLSSSTLKSSIYNIFKNMGENATDEEFAKEISNTVKDFFISADISTTDSGTISTGVFTGTGTKTSITADSSSCISTIINCCVSMRSMTSGGNEVFAQALATGFSGMFNSAILTTLVKGTVVSTSGVSSAITGSATGTTTTVSSTMYSDFMDAFNSMNVKSGESIDSYLSRLGVPDTYADGNEYLADKMAISITNDIHNGVVNTAGTGTLAGSVGVGTML